MKNAPLFTLAAALLFGVAQAAGPTVQTLPNSRVVTYLGTTPGWFICDDLSAPTVSVMGWPGARGLSRLTTYSKARAGQFVYRDYRVGRADVGAGQIHHPLMPGGPNTAGSGLPNNVASFNVGALPHPEQALTPNIVSLTSTEASGRCRWTLNTRLLGFGARRSLLITETPGGQLAYRTFDFADAGKSRPVMTDETYQSSTPSLSIVGGSRTLSNAAETFVFQNAGYTYTVRVARQDQSGAPRQPAGASVTVSRGGQVLQTERLTAYTYSVRR